MVLPRIVRSKLHLTPGTKFRCDISGDSVILTPEKASHIAKEYVTDPTTGLRVTKARKKSDPVTTEMIKALLDEYP